MIKITSLDKIYRTKKHRVYRALNDLNLCLPDTGFIFLIGESGSGKSTLLNLIGGLDSQTKGKIEVDGKDLSLLSESEFADYRNTQVGFIFQDCHLIDELSVYENIALPLDFCQKTDDTQVKEALCKVGLSGYEDKYPAELSGGERQRVAIARAIVKNPRIILADEPTGNLDEENTKIILQLLKSFSQEGLVFLVSHNLQAAESFADRTIHLSHGSIIADVTNKSENIRHETPLRPVKLQKTKLRFSTIAKLSGKFLKHKIPTISLYAFMVTVIMIVMALAQTITAFNTNQMVRNELRKNRTEALYLTKTLTEEQQKHIAQLDMVNDCFPEITQTDILEFTDAGYDDTIYPVLKYTINLFQSNVSAGMATNIFEGLPYILEPLGTILVDELFLEKKYGEIRYLAKAETFHPTGIIITDYLADIIILSNQVSYAKDYDSLIGPYHWGTKDAYSCVSRGYINGILDTGYQEEYATLINRLADNENTDIDTLTQNPEILQFAADIHTKYGFCYSLNANFTEDARTNPAWDTLWHYSLQLNQGRRFTNTIPQVRSASFYGIELKENEVLMEINTYNKVFGTNYTAETLSSFQSHTAQLQHYKYFDTDDNQPLFSMEINIAGLFVPDQNNMSGTFIAGNRVYAAFAKDHIYTTGLYFDNVGKITHVLDTAETLGYRSNLMMIESTRTMAQAVEAFAPIFRLFSVLLHVAVIFLLMNFASKMINSKMHEIGILKALGGKNGSVGMIFGLQIVLIAVITGVLSTLGYLFFVDLTNDLLVESLRSLVSDRFILDLDFLIFRWDVVAQNSLLIIILALISFVIPLLKIRASHPVKIIRTKE